MYLKKELLRDRKYLDSFKGKRCCICYSTSTTVGHHLRINGGTGVKAPDDETIPLCYLHHEEIHRNEKAFINKYGRVFNGDAVKYAKELYKKYLDSE